MADSVGAPLSLKLTKARLEEVTKAVSNYDYIRFTFSDMNGIPRGVVMPARVVPKNLKSGIYCYSGFHLFGANNETVMSPFAVDAHCGNVLNIPDVDSLHPLPWLGNGKYKMGEFLTETYWDYSTPQAECSRNIARRLLGRLDDLGLKMFSGMELEYFLFDKQTGKPVFTGLDVWSTLTQSEFDSWFTEVDQHMAKVGVSIELMLLEYAPGQFEFVSSPEFGIKGADCSMLFKHGIKELALQRGWQANFMAKVFPEYNGNGGHFNFSIWDKETGENAFWDKDNHDHLSPMAKHWIAGMLHHAKALTALCCITTNCYQRLHTPWSPHYANWGIEDRMAMIRVKNYGPSSTYIENRLPSGLFNSYLVMAGTIAAGLDGIQNKLSCPDPYITDGSPELPHSLEEAMDELVKDEVMVEAMGKTFVDLFIKLKTEADLKAIEGLTTQAEVLKKQHEVYARLM